MENPLTVQKEQLFFDVLELQNTLPFLDELLASLRRCANDPAFVAAFARDTGRRVPEFLVERPGDPLAPLVTLWGMASAKQRGEAKSEDWVAFCHYVFKYLKAQKGPAPMEAPPLTQAPRYDEDFYAWTQATASACRAGDWYRLDREALAEELESLGARDRRELRTRLQRLVTHLLKWRYQPGRRGRSWQLTIRTQRQDIADLLDQSPSLRRSVPEALEARYALAREHASAQTRLPLATFPETCSWTPEQVLDVDFWPEE